MDSNTRSTYLKQTITPFIKISLCVTHLQWMVLGMSGPPGACAHPPAAGVIVTVPAHASCPRTEESLAAAPQDKPSSATSLSAQVRTESKDFLNNPLIAYLDLMTVMQRHDTRKTRSQKVPSTCYVPVCSFTTILDPSSN